MEPATGIVILASNLPPGLAEFRQRHIHHPGAVVPLHTTLVYSFLGLRDFEQTGAKELRQIAAAMPPFRYYANSLCTFPTANALWLAPTPQEPFERLTQAIYDRFRSLTPEVGYPSYHMTIGLTEKPGDLPQVVDEFQASYADRLPVEFVCKELAVFVADTYRIHSTFPLGSG